MSRRRERHVITVRSLNAAATRGVLNFGCLRFPCAIGRGGIKALKREGDGATPRGMWSLRQAFYRADKMARPRAGLPLAPLRKDDGWCDTPGDRNYNRRISHPYPGSAEGMWRDDDLYDVVIVLGYNDRPRIAGRGSAIFMHLVRPGFAPTQGCVALRRGDLLRLLAVLPARAAVRVMG